MQVEPETAAVIDALLPQIAFEGWTSKALRQALQSIGQPPEDAPLIFPGGAADMIEAFCTLADRRMVEAAEAEDWSARRIPARVKRVLEIRFEQNRGNKEAIRRALSWLSLPPNMLLAGRTTARTVDAIWHAAGDMSADFSWYTKRGILAAVYSATLLYWLTDTSLEDEKTLQFLDRRLAGVGRIGRIRKRMEERFSSLRGFVPRRAD